MFTAPPCIVPFAISASVVAGGLQSVPSSQRPRSPAVATRPAPAAGMTNADVIKLAKAGFTDELILASISKAAKTIFDLTPDGLVGLKTSGVSEKVINAMLAKTDGVTAPASRQTVAPAPRPESSTDRPAPDGDAVGTQGPQRFTPQTPLPDEIGMYLRLRGQLKDLPPEIVNWRTGGFLKRVATAGLTGGHVNGWISNPRSPTVITLPAEVLIYTPEGTAVTEYQLLRFFEKSTRREFRAMSTGVVNTKSGAGENLIEFASDKIAPRTYSVRLQNLPAGEYGFLPPGTAAGSNLAMSGKVYSFSVK